MNQKQRIFIYWVCQVLGWGFYTLFLLFLTLSFDQKETSPLVIQLQFIIGVTLLFVSHGLKVFYKKYQWTTKSIKWVILRLLLVTIAASFLAQFIIHGAMLFVIDWESYRPIKLNEFFVYVFNVNIIFILWSILYFSFHYFENNRKKEIENLELRANLKDAEVTILKSQINPHFLFNALNNIRSLILIEPEKARDMITHISELLRYFIQFNSQETVTVQQEIEVVKDYLKLESIQFDERLTYSIDLDENSLHVKIPPMSIQLLVENAIKHGLSNLPQGGFIKIQTSSDQESLTISVTNSGKINSAQSKSGIGLKNLSERIELVFGKVSDFELIQNTNETVTAMFKVPLVS